MAHLTKKRYTKPIPPGAAIIKVRGVPSARFKDSSGKTVTAPLTADGTRIRLLSAKWYAVFSKAEGGGPPVPLFTDQTASLARLAELVRKRELGEAGIADPFERHRRRPLTEHIDDWRASLANDGAGDKHTDRLAGCVRRIVEDCRFSVIADISASRVQQFLADLRVDASPAGIVDASQEWYTAKELALLLSIKSSAIGSLIRRHRLADQTRGNGKSKRYARAVAEVLLGMRGRGASIRTSNAYLSATKQFCNWMVADRRMLANPLTHLSGANMELDRRHIRRIFDVNELRAVFSAANSSDKVFRGLTGIDREMLYLTACVTGFRASELSSLRPQDFDIDQAQVTIQGVYAKNRRTVIQPIPVEAAETLRSYLAGKPAPLPIWPGTWHERAADMLRIDLDAAGIPYIVDGPSGPQYADFHAFGRHSYIAMLDRIGATLKEAMQLARHSDPKLTMRVYGQHKIETLASAVDKLPTLTSGTPNQAEELRATGTDGSLPACRLACRLAETHGDAEQRSDNPDVADGCEGDCSKPDSGKDFATVEDTVRQDETTTPGVTRTRNLRFRRPLPTDPNPLPTNTSGESPTPLAVSLADKDVSALAAAVAALSPEQRASLAEALARTQGQEQAGG